MGIGTIRISNVEEMRGDETPCFRFDVHADGELLGNAISDGHGGPAWLRIVPGTSVEQRESWYAYCTDCNPDFEPESSTLFDLYELWVAQNERSK